MNKLLLLGTLLLLSACATDNEKTAFVRSGGTECIGQTANISGTDVKTRWCSSRQMFRPNSHVVRLDGALVFEGTDFKDVALDTVLNGKRLLGGCVPRIQLTDMATQRSMAVSLLPPSIVQRCDVRQDANGLALPFLQTEDCWKAQSDDFAPFVGKVFRFKGSQECRLSLDDVKAFEGIFYYY